MKDILRMTRKERMNYMITLDIDEELKKAIDFKIKLSDFRDDRYIYNFSSLFSKSFKLFNGHNRTPLSNQEKLNYLFILINMFVVLEVYNDYIKESESL